MADLKILRNMIAAMSNDLFVTCDISLEKINELQRQLLASFTFGMVFAIGQIEKLTPPEVHALAISMLMDGFNYSAEQSRDFANELIASATDTGNPTIKAVIHRGIDGHRQWLSKEHGKLRSNIESIFRTVST